MKRPRQLATLVLVCALPAAVSAQPPAREEISPRITRIETWLWAIANHTPGVVDDALLRVKAWDQQELRFIWIEVNTLVSMIRDPDVQIFSAADPPRPTGQPVRSPNMAPRGRSFQVFYRVAEQRRLNELAKAIAPPGSIGRDNDLLTRGAMLHADIAMSAPFGAPGGDLRRAGPGTFTMLMDDGQQTGRQESVSHFDMGRRLLDRVRPVNSRTLPLVPDPGKDETVRSWYLATCAFMARMRQIEPNHFERAIELFPDDAEMLMFAAAVHESFAGVRTQSAIRTANIPRDVDIGVRDEGMELRRAESLYKRALEANPKMAEARIRLGRVLGLRGRHKEAVAELQQGLTATEPLLQFYARLFLGREFEELGNGAEARQSYEQAAAIDPRAPSALLGLSRVMDQAGDRAAARAVIERMLALPPEDVDRADPWWVYEIAQARRADELLANLRQRFVQTRRSGQDE